MSHLVRFFDIDGTILKQEYVTTGANATAPITPNYDPKYLVFAEWNQPFTNVQSDLNIGAMYDTVDGKTYIFIRINNITGFQPTLQINKLSSDLLTINWGDGTTNTTTTGGNVQKTAAYAAVGDYLISIDCAGIYQNSFNNTLVGVTNTGVLKIYLGTNFRLNSRGGFNTLSSMNVISLNKEVQLDGVSIFSGCRSLKHINASSLSSGATIGGSQFLNCNSLKYISISAPSPVSVESIAFQDCNCLKSFGSYTINVSASTFVRCYNLDANIVLDTNTTIIHNQLFTNCTSLESVTMLGNVTSVEFAAFDGGSRLTEMEFPASLTSIAGSAFINCTAILEYTFNSTTPPTLANTNAFTGINAACKIYVPDANVNDYKTATNWSTYANYIYPLSTKP
jgi:hypothetical protein